MTPHMADRFLARCLWAVIMGLIAASAVAALVLLYSGLFHLISRNLESATLALGTGSLLLGGCWALCRHSDDLIDRPR